RGFTARSGLVDLAPFALSAAGEEPDEANEEGQVNGQEVVADQGEPDAPDALPEEVADQAPPVEQQLETKERSVERRLEQGRAGHQHGDEEEGQGPAQQLVRDEGESRDRVQGPPEQAAQGPEAAG